MKKLCLLLVLCLALGLLPAAAEDAYVTGKDAWEIELSSSKTAQIRNPIDDNLATYWHTHYTNEGSTITGHDMPPFTMDLTLPDVTTVSGFVYTTRQDGGRGGICTKYNVYAASKDDDDWHLLETGTFDDQKGRKEHLFVVNVRVKKFRFEILDGVGGYGSCAEFDFRVADADKQTVDPENYAAVFGEIGIVEISMTDTVVTANTDSWLDHTPDLVLDGTIARFWQTASGVKGPYVLDFDFGKTLIISSIDVVPRQSQDFHGAWTTFSIWVSDDGENYTLAKENLHFEKSLDIKSVAFDTPLRTRFIEFEITDGYTGKASCAEIKFYQTMKEKREQDEGDFQQYVLKVGSPEIKVTHGNTTETVTLDVAPYIYKGSTLIPLRGLLEQMGAEVTWTDRDQSILVESPARKIELQIWSNLVYVTGGKYGRVRYTLLQEPRIEQSRTFIPLRFVSEHLGYRVDWDGNTQTITITSSSGEEE